MGARPAFSQCLVTVCLVVTVSGISGCRSEADTSPDAVSLPYLDRDPREETTEPQQWPMWRGLNGSGVVASPSPSLKFSADEGHLWKTPMDGKGNSSPVVWGDRVFLTSAFDTTDPISLYVLCFDRNDGRELWRTEVGKVQGKTHTKNGHASASVATDGEHLYAFFGTTGLFCLDLSGRQVWRADLGDLGHHWGTAASPILHDDLVIQLCDASSDCSIAAFRSATGEPVWRTARPGTGCWSTPVILQAEVDGQTRDELIVNGSDPGRDNGQVTAYDPATGKELWRVFGTKRWVTPTPVVGEGVVYCMSGRNGPLMAIRPGGSGNVNNTHMVWKASRGGSYIPSAVLYRNRLFVVGDGQVITCYNAGNGEQIWRERIGGAYTASLVAADGRIYAVSESGAVSIVAAADTYQMLARNQLNEPCLATPAIVGGQLFIRTAEHLYCIPPEQ